MTPADTTPRMMGAFMESLEARLILRNTPGERRPIGLTHALAKCLSYGPTVSLGI